MEAVDLISLYTKNEWIQSIANKINKPIPNCIHIKGAVGSLPAILGTALYKLTNTTQLFILRDKEEAAYLYTDLYNLSVDQNILFYPAIGEKDNKKDYLSTASNLTRNQILQQLIQENQQPKLIVTHTQAISATVQGKESLANDTWIVNQGEKIILSDFLDKLTEIGFDRVDFVYEVGQFSVRGGIIDIFSYGNQFPYRIELTGKTVESIRIFNPFNQISIEELPKALLFFPSHKNGEYNHSFLEFLPTNTVVWFKNYDMVLEEIKQNHKLYKRDKLSKDASGENITETNDTISKCEKIARDFTCIEFGKKSYLNAKEIIEYNALPQPNFNQYFEGLIKDLQKNEQLGLETIILSESSAQFGRLKDIFSELDINIKFKALSIGLSQGYIDQKIGIVCYTDHQIFGRYYRYKLPKQYSKSQSLILKELKELKPGDYVVHMDHGIARFGGLSKVEVNNKEQEVLRLIYKDNDVVYVNLHALYKISKYSGKESTVPSLSKIGNSAWDSKKLKVKNKVKDIAKELIQLYSQRKHAVGFAFSKDNFLQAELESSFIYEDTPDQAAATVDVKKDMELPHPMDRLVCGDVGFGKTEVAIRAAFKAVQDHKQVAVLVPTTILAMQHYESFKERLANFSTRIQYINRFKNKNDVAQIRKDIELGNIDILIGTHTILGKAFNFKDLGLLIIDEEQKFGVQAKDRIKELKTNVDVLTLTATPIPRTLHFSLMGARDLSIITTPPLNRHSVETFIHVFDKKVIQDAIHYEVQRGGQIFFVHNRVSSIQDIAQILQKLVPDYRLGIAHGQMHGDQLEKIMLSFIAGKYDVLISTNIIESGLDIPNANTIIINDSHMFGMSDLHQMRGRVGRSNKKAFCYLIAPPISSLTSEACKRLGALEEFSELGDGFKVAMRDLDIRGAGNLLGAEQSGFIADVGFEAYCKILDEAVQELKQNEFQELFVDELESKQQVHSLDCILETDLELLIPNTYVSNDSERLRLYTMLESIEDDKGLESYQAGLQDRFGTLPPPVVELIKAVKLRWIAKKLGLQKIRLKDNVMRCYFISTQTKSFFAEILNHVLSFVEKNPQKCQLKETNNQLILSISTIETVEEAQKVLERVAGELLSSVR